MGEIYCLSDKEVEDNRSKVIEQLNKYKATKSVDNLTLFLIWLYEFIEMFSVNRKNVQGKLRTVKDLYNLEVVSHLFRIRGSLVHRCYSVLEDKVIKFYERNEQDLFELMQLAGFDLSTMQSTVQCKTSNVF